MDTKFIKWLGDNFDKLLLGSVLTFDCIVMYLTPSYLLAFCIGWVGAFLFNALFILPKLRQSLKTMSNTIDELLADKWFNNLPKKENGLVDIDSAVKKL